MLRIASVAILARLLTPEDFGVIALVLPLTVLVNTTANLRLEVAALQRDDLDSAGLSRSFGIAQRFNAAVAIAMAALGPVLALFYHDRRVIGVTAAWAAATYVLYLGAFHEALLKRQMRFALTVSLETAAMVLGLVAAVGAALLGAGYWALVIQMGVLAAVRATSAWLVCPWRPSRPREGVEAPAAVPGMVKFGRELTLFQALRWGSQQIDRMLVGVSGGAAILGLYDGARRWAWLPYQELHLSLSDVAVAGFSRARERPEALRQLVGGTVTAILGIALPVVAFVTIEAEGAIRILLGDQWLGAVPFLRILGLGAFLGCVARPTEWVFSSLGRTDRQLRWIFVQTAVTIGCLAIGSFRGALGVAVGFSAAQLLLAYPTIAYCLRGTSLRGRDFLGALGRPVLASAFAGAILIGARAGGLAALDLAPRLLVESALIGIACAAAWLAMPGGRRALGDAWRFVRRLGSLARARMRTRPDREGGRAPIP